MRPHWIMNSTEWEAEALAQTQRAERQRDKIARYGLGTRAPKYMLDTLERFETRAREARSNSAKAWEEEQHQQKG